MTDDREATRPGRIRKAAGVALRGLPWLVLGALIAWAVTTVFLGPEDAAEEPDFALAEAESGTLEHELRLNVSAAWTPGGTLTNAAAGVLTEVRIEPGTAIEAGEVLYTVDLRPTVLAQGEVPSFRDLRRGDDGLDVKQLQGLLAELGHFAGAADGEFGAGTASAVRTWQRELGVEVDGVIRASDVLYVESAPARLTVSDDYPVGAALSGGEALLAELEGPQFSVDLTPAQAEEIPVDAAVTITAAEAEWSAAVSEFRADPETDDLIVAVLESTTEDPICAADCEQIPVGEPTLLESSIVLLEPVEATLVPDAAVVTNAQGETGVVSDDGDFLPVEVLGVAEGVAGVEGIDPGVRVRVPGEAAS